MSALLLAELRTTDLAVWGELGRVELAVWGELGATACLGLLSGLFCGALALCLTLLSSALACFYFVPFKRNLSA